MFDTRFGFPPRPLQQEIRTAAEAMDGPGLLIVEAPMGEGKTEAALVAAEILARRFGAHGLFFGLPTQATTDAVFSRVSPWLAAVQPGAALALSHGKSIVNAEYAAMPAWRSGEVGVDCGCDVYSPSAWFSGRKRLLLSPHVVGTVDNLLIAGAQVRHVALHHLGFAQKVVILDEVHAVDIYMSQFLERCLAWLGASRVPVVLLSATLPTSMRRRLITAYTGQQRPVADHYPQIAENMSEGLLALAVSAGLQVMRTLMEADASALAGPKGKHDANRTAVRHGRERGSVTLGGRRVPVTRPRVRAADGTGELPIASYELFSSTEILGRLAMEKMLAGLSTRRYPVGLEPVGQQVTEKSSATGKSAVSRRFVAMTETALAELLSADLSGLDLIALMIDGVHFAESCCVVALGIDIEGNKHPLALVEGSTENATLVTELLVGVRERGLDVTRPMLVGIDGAKALRKAVLDVLDHPVIQRCQIHKVRNVKDHLPQRLRSTVGAKMTAAYHADSALEAQAALLALAKELDRTHPGAAASLREGLEETLTVLRLGVPPTLARTLRSTNAIESMISVCRDHASNVKRWRNGQMALRWCAAGMAEAGKQFRRVNGHLHLPALRAALEAECAQPVAPVVHNGQVSAA